VQRSVFRLCALSSAVASVTGDLKSIRWKRVGQWKRKVNEIGIVQEKRGIIINNSQKGIHKVETLQ